MIVVMNRLTVPSGAGDRLETMFRQRAGLGQTPGFIDFALLRAQRHDATDQEQYVVLTRWRDRAAFEAWVASDAFARAHSTPQPGNPMQAQVEIYDLLHEEHGAGD